MNNWLKNKTGFITGATGWIGSWVCKYLDSIGAPYAVLPHTPDNDIDNFWFPNKCDYIIHLAPGRVGRVIECAKVFRCPVLFTSSGAVYMEQPNDYAKQKIANENAFIASGIDAKIARCFTFAGRGVPFDRNCALGNFIHAAVSGQPMCVWSGGETIRTYMYMTDLVDWLFNILVNGVTGKAYDVGSEDEISILEVAQEVQKHLGGEILMEKKGMESMPYYVPYTEEAQRLGCTCTMTSREAIRKTCAYYETQ